VLALGDLDRPGLPALVAASRCRPSACCAPGWEPADDEELALACASHSGEPEHLDVVRGCWRARARRGRPRLPAMLPLSEPVAHALLRAGGEATPADHELLGQARRDAGLLRRERLADRRATSSPTRPCSGR
jgi:hypothetical protein